MKGGHSLLGNFRGRFYTHQNVSLTGTEFFPEDLSHQMHIYAAEFHDAAFEEGGAAHHFERHGSMTFQHVPNVVIFPCSPGGFDERRIYNLNELVLIRPKVLRTYVIGDKTYGEIESQAFGKTEAFQRILPMDGEDVEFVSPPLVGEDYDTTAPPVPGDDGQGGNRPSNPGCLSILTSWLSYLWRVALALLVLLAVIGLLKSCGGQTWDGCEQKAVSKKELTEEKQYLDSMRINYDLNLKNAISAYGTIYFFKNSVDFHPNSLGNNSPVSRIYRLMEAYEDKQFVIEGYHSGEAIEPLPQLDSLRAARMRDTLSRLGIPAERIQLDPRGDEIMSVRSRALHELYQGQNRWRQYNANMRVVVKVAEPHE